MSGSIQRSGLVTERYKLMSNGSQYGSTASLSYRKFTWVSYFTQYKSILMTSWWLFRDIGGVSEIPLLIFSPSTVIPVKRGVFITRLTPREHISFHLVSKLVYPFRFYIVNILLVQILLIFEINDLMLEYKIQDILSYMYKIYINSNKIYINSKL